MFSFVVIFYLMVNGVPAPEPMGQLTYNQNDFPTKEACMAFVETPDGKALRAYVEALLENNHGRVVAQAGCLPREDNTL